MRLIDAEPVIRELQNEEEYGADYYYPIELLKTAPTVEAKPVVHAHWDIGGMRLSGVVGNWKCSACKRTSLDDSNYCPNCGAQMDEGIKEVNDGE